MHEQARLEWGFSSPLGSRICTSNAILAPGSPANYRCTSPRCICFIDSMALFYGSMYIHYCDKCVLQYHANMKIYPLHPLASSLLIPLSRSLLLMTPQSACPGDNGYCLPTYSLCNGVKDCPNGTDEDPSFCSSYNCSSAGLVRCPALQWHGPASLERCRLGCTNAPRMHAQLHISSAPSPAHRHLELPRFLPHPCTILGEGN